MKLGKYSGERGISLIGIIFIGAVLACLGVLGAQVAPTVLEYQTVLKAIDKAKSANTIAEARSVFEKAAQIDDIKSISGKDLEIEKNGDKLSIKFAYTREIHMFGPAYLLLKYAGQAK